MVSKSRVYNCCSSPTVEKDDLALLVLKLDNELHIKTAILNGSSHVKRNRKPRLVSRVSDPAIEVCCVLQPLQAWSATVARRSQDHFAMHLVIGLNGCE